MTFGIEDYMDLLTEHFKVVIDRYSNQYQVMLYLKFSGEYIRTCYGSSLRNALMIAVELSSLK